MPTTLPGAALLRPIYRPLRRLASSWGNRVRRLATARKLAAYDRLHLGAGPCQIPGWANIDVYGRRNLIWDLRKKLPIREKQLRFIYAEHFIEHVSRPEALRLLQSLRPLLGDDGVLRLSTPDLHFFAAAYLRGELVGSEPYGWFPKSLCEMMNDQMRKWGHQYLYDEPELRALLAKAGFKNVKRVGWRESEHEALRGIETRPAAGDLILEAR